ncbi:TPA: GNAT family N-acetyltransferase [Morganella morganii]|nr:GNAT family N-acetyltransferase [Morganella morganii]
MTEYDFVIKADDLSSPQTGALIVLHLQGMAQNTPQEHVYALDQSGLRADNIRVWSVWDGERIAAVGALKQLSAAQGEIKSMRAHPDFRGKGAGKLLLLHIIAQAKQGGMTRLSLETGCHPDFEPALALYRRCGFLPGTAFGDYQPGEHHQFFHLDL